MRTNCRDEILISVRSIIKAKRKNEFTVAEVMKDMKSRGTTYKDSSISTHINSKCCVNAPAHHAMRYDDFERVSVGVYRLLKLD